MKPNLFMKRKLEIGLTLLIGMSAFWGSTMTWLRYAKIKPYLPI